MRGKLWMRRKPYRGFEFPSAPDLFFKNSTNRTNKRGLFKEKTTAKNTVKTLKSMPVRKKLMANILKTDS
jgi:hypothetical protein